MRSLRIALAQINQTVGDLEGNTARIIRAMEEARDWEADLVAFPELAIPGYPPEDLLLKPQFVKDNLAKLQDVITASKGISAVVGFVDTDGDLYNAAAVIHDGELVGVYHKMFLPNYGVFDEDRYFQVGTQPQVYLLHGVAIGISICEDIWYPNGPPHWEALAGAEVIININGSPFHAGKGIFREKMLATRATDNGVMVAYLNLVGGQDELVFDGHSLIFDEKGELIARGKEFQEELVLADLDVEGVFRSRLHDPRRRKDALRVSQEGTKATYRVISKESPQWPKKPLPARDAAPKGYPGEIYEALVLGTRDYVRKNGFQKVVIGLSGGIDSSITAVIAADALGPENVTGVAMPSRYSSEGSIKDAQNLADNLGIRLLMVTIEDAFSAYLHTLEEPFKGTEPNVAEENIQARIRGNILMALSNKFGWLVLTTGNKSELATGYATLYGDMAGGFAVIKDVPKTLVYELARYRNSLGPSPVIPESVLVKPPTAELKPNQLDQDTLPPYEVLDPILKAYVEEDRSFEEMLAMGFQEETVKRVIRMVDQNEYKRRQGAPGVKITPRAFGKDRRLPIVNRYRSF